MVTDGRDALVNLLNGERGGADARRNRRDDYHLRLLLRFGLRADSNCLEVGANQGMFLYDICRVAPDGHHIAYEPIARLAEKLATRFPQVEIRQRALSDVDGDAQFVRFVDPGFQGLSGLADHVDLASRPGDIRTELITVATERLDDHLPPGWLPDLIKIDVEGAEHLVLQGALSTLQRAKPVVAFEHGLTDGVSEEIYGLLCGGVGLRMFNMDGDGPLSLAQFLDQLRTRWNWVAHR
jgi:FkbM family methyltransferase